MLGVEELLKFLPNIYLAVFAHFCHNYAPLRKVPPDSSFHLLQPRAILRSDTGNIHKVNPQEETGQ